MRAQSKLHHLFIPPDELQRSITFCDFAKVNNLVSSPTLFLKFKFKEFVEDQAVKSFLHS